MEQTLAQICRRGQPGQPFSESTLSKRIDLFDSRIDLTLVDSEKLYTSSSNYKTRLKHYLNSIFRYFSIIYSSLYLVYLPLNNLVYFSVVVLMRFILFCAKLVII